MGINQKNRLMIIGALTVLLSVSIYENGLNVLWIALVAIISSLVVELLATHLRKETYDFTAYFITPLVIALIVPYNILNHVWMVSLGVMFGLFFAKALFGGQDKNVFNAEALGLIFIIMSFPTYLLNQKSGNAVGDLFIYTSLGLAVVLMALKAISVYTVISFLVTLFGFYFVSYLSNGANPNPMDILLTTNMVFIGLFMGSEHSTGSKTNIGKLMYGITLGFLMWLINTKSSNREFAGIYAVILVNAISPLIDQFVSAYIIKPTIKEVIE